MTNRESENEMAGRIVKSIEDHWAEHKKPLLLSQLGDKENGNVAHVAKEKSGSLKAYLESHLAERVRVVQHSSKPQVIGALPAQNSIDDGISIDELFSEASGPKAVAVARYHPAVWAAFRKPLDNGNVRYLSVEGLIRFVDVTSAMNRAGYVKVDREFIGSMDNDPKVIETNILRWTDTNGLDAFRFRSRKPSVRQFPSNDLLSAFLASLGEEDLRRISIPLDIVHKLRSKQL
ncbi:MAG: hypothetical protein OXF88_04885 [Rhodobacteraceae bacterium]|nr:hypothetical protein [Paracoccaceae bacterium]